MCILKKGIKIFIYFGFTTMLFASGKKNSEQKTPTKRKLRYDTLLKQRASTKVMPQKVSDIFFLLSCEKFRVIIPNSEESFMGKITQNIGYYITFISIFFASFLYNLLLYFIFEPSVKKFKSWSDSFLSITILHMGISCFFFWIIQSYAMASGSFYINIFLFAMSNILASMLASIIRYLIFNIEVKNYTKKRRKKAREEWEASSFWKKGVKLAEKIFSKDEL